MKKISEENKKNIIYKFSDIIVLIVFSVLTLIGALRHEMWFDEAEAWVISRDNSFGSLGNVLKAEGHPFLWYLILKILTSAGFSADFVPVISWLFTVLTVMIILFKSPFRKIINYLVVFSSGFIYFNSVISRVYCLIPLFLVMIADVFPKRKKHPVYYGVLIAMLTNTHICICGIVAVLGINMLADLIKDWKTNSVKDRIFSVTGIITAGSGVVLLFFTLLGSIDSNAEVTKDSSALSDSLSGVFLALFDVPVQAALTSDSGIISVLVCILFITCILLIAFLIRRNRVSLIILLVFNVCYLIICGVIWYTNPNRAAIVYFVLFLASWIALSDKEAKPDNKKIHIDSDIILIRRFMKFISELDSDYNSALEKITGIIFAMTIPLGFIYLFNDYNGDFAFEKSAAKYISENYKSQDTVILTKYDSFPQLACYMPDYTFYSLCTGNEYTYHDHSISYDDMMNMDMYNEKETENYLEKWNKLIYVDVNRFDDYAVSLWFSSAPGEIVFSGTGSMDFISKSTNIMVCETTSEELLRYIGKY